VRFPDCRRRPQRRIGRAQRHSPVISLYERLEIVRNIAALIYCATGDDERQSRNLAGLRFDILFKGDDWRGTEMGNRLERDFAAKAISSSALRRVLQDIDAIAAGQALANSWRRQTTQEIDPAEERDIQPNLASALGIPRRLSTLGSQVGSESQEAGGGDVSPARIIAAANRI
jgi:hypothetical protein